MSRRATRRPRKSSCLYLSWAFPGWNKGGGGGLFLSLRLFSTLLLLVTFPSRSLPDEMGTQPRRPRRLQTFLSELFTELQFLVFATFLYITDPSLVFFFRQLFLYVLLCVSFFFFFFLYRYIADRSFHSLSARYQQGKDVLLLLRCTKRKSRFEEERFWFDKNVLISVVV